MSFKLFKITKNEKTFKNFEEKKINQGAWTKTVISPLKIQRLNLNNPFFIPENQIAKKKNLNECMIAFSIWCVFDIFAKISNTQTHRQTDTNVLTFLHADEKLANKYLTVYNEKIVY